MTNEQKKIIIAWATGNSQTEQYSFDETRYCGIIDGAQYVIDHPSDFNLASYDTFKKEPVAALLTNALLYCTPEQLIALRNALNERTGDKLFGREEVVKLVEAAYKEGFSQNGMPLGEWSDNLESNEENLSGWIEISLKNKS
jgi:hypothetical protein